MTDFSDEDGNVQSDIISDIISVFNQPLWRFMFFFLKTEIFSGLSQSNYELHFRSDVSSSVEQ